MNPTTIMNALACQQSMYETAEALEKEPGRDTQKLAEILFNAISEMDAYLKGTPEYEALTR
jgi:hypothetical protein